MFCKSCGKVVADDAKFCSNCGAKVDRAGISIEQDIATLKGSASGAVVGKGADIHGLDADIDQTVETVESGGAVVGAVVGGEDSHIHVGGEQQYGDTIQGDKVQGDKVVGDKISTGKISGTGVVIGRGGTVTVTQGLSGEDVAALFAPVQAVIQSVPGEDQAAAQQTLYDLEGEVAKGDQAHDSRMAELIDDLVGLVPGAVSAVVSVFASPILSDIAGPVTNFVLQRLV